MAQKRTKPVTMDQADALVRALGYQHRVDDHEQTADGHVYTLEDGGHILIKWDGSHVIVPGE